MLRRRSLMGGGPKDYIEFANEKLGAFFAQKYGDGIGITYEQAAAVTSFDFQLYNEIGKELGAFTFDEINYFTGLVSISLRFYYNSTYDHSKGMTISRLALPNLESIGYDAFFYCNILEVDCPKLKTMDTGSFRASGTKRFILGDAYTSSAANGPINYNEDLEYLYFSNLQSIDDYHVVFGCTNANLKVYIATPSGVPTINVSTYKPDTDPWHYIWGFVYGTVETNAELYVPSNLVSAYKAAGAPWTTAFVSINAI